MEECYTTIRKWKITLEPVLPVKSPYYFPVVQIPRLISISRCNAVGCDPSRGIKNDILNGMVFLPPKKKTVAIKILTLLKKIKRLK